MRSPTLIIGSKSYSSWSLRPWLLLKKLDVAFEEVVIALDRPDTRERILRHSPAGKVPILVDGGVTVWESLAICEHVAERHPDAWPADPRARALARSVASEMHAGFVALRTEMPMNCRERRSGVVPSPAARADIARIADIWDACRRASGEEGQWLFGRFSIADAMYAPVALRFHTYGVEISEAAARYAATIYDDAHIKEWIAAAKTEPARNTAFEKGTPLA
jgi:glutathione S-transferase